MIKPQVTPQRTEPHTTVIDLGQKSKNRRTRPTIGVALTLCAAMCSNVAIANLVQQSVNGPTQAFTAVFDSETSLQWISPTATQGRTVSAVLGNYGGWMAAGYRYATTDELQDLITHAGLTGGTSTALAPSQRQWYSEQDIGEMQWLIIAMGWTSQDNQPSQGDPFGARTVYGVLGDFLVINEGLPYSVNYASFGAGANIASASFRGQWLYNSQDGQVGSFLVREVTQIPEPSTVSLLAAGLIAFFGLARWNRYRRTQTRS